MTAGAFAALQAGIYTTLTEDAGLIALIGDGGSPERARIFDRPSPDSTFPYVTIGNLTALPWDTKTSDGMEATVQIDVWSKHKGMSEAAAIMDAIVAALDDQSFSVSGHTLINCRMTFSEMLDDPDGLTRHGVQHYRMVTQGD